MYLKLSRLHVVFAGDEAVNSNESNWSMDCSTVLRVKTLHISSPILAAKSPFFYKVKVISFFTWVSLAVVQNLWIRLVPSYF